MFSNWFSGDDLERYRTSPHKQRFDAIASSLLRLKYAREVIRQHLHEWLRFSRTLDAKEATPLRLKIGSAPDCCNRLFLGELHSCIARLRFAGRVHIALGTGKQSTTTSPGLGNFQPAK